MHTPETLSDPRAAAALIQWGLRPQARPAQEQEYRKLIDRYLDEPGFRRLTSAVADGLGLSVLEASAHGLVLAPAEGSAFALPPSGLSSSAGYADDRLIDGLVQVAIAATVFPRARDLDDDPDRARPPLTVSEVAAQLAGLCEALAARSRGGPDPEAGEQARGLYEAWRVYQSRSEAPGGRRSTRRAIESGLEHLRSAGCFTSQPGDKASWRPTRRYQILVRELAATQLYREVQRALSDRTGEI